MPLPLSERPPTPPPAKPPKPILGDHNAAAQYKARWDVPMPISSAEERRSPVVAPPPSDMPSHAEMYQARWDTPMPKPGDSPATGADVGALIGALTGLSAKDVAGATAGAAAGGAAGKQAFDVNGVERARGLLEAAPQQQQAASTDYTQVKPGEFHGSWDAYGSAEGATTAPPTAADKIARAEQAVSDAERERRKHAIGADKKDHSGRTPISKRTDRMTPEEYAALSDTQRAAVDFNAMLVQAVRTDRKNEDTYDQTDEQQATYDADVAAMFGKDGGSKRYAPATMALLGQLGYQDNAGDLDDFLRLKAAVKEKDIKRLDLQGDMVNVPGQGQREVLGPQVQRQADGDVLNPVQYDRVQLAGTLAAKTSVLQEQLAKGTALLQTMNATAALDRNPRVELYGGKPNEPKVAAGFGAPADTSGTTTMDGYFQKAVENMADPKFDAASIYQTVKARATPEQFNAFLTFARAKAEQAKRYGVALSGAENARSPEEFTKLLATIGGGS